MRIKVPATESKLWTPADLQRQRTLLGDFSYEQKFELKFVDDESQVFPEELVSAAFRNDVRPLFERAR